MRWVIFTLIVFLLFGCSGQKYIVTSDPNMIHSYQTKIINNGDWLNPNEEYQVLNKVIYIPNSLKENTTLKHTMQYLNKNKVTECEEYLNRVNQNEKHLPIAKGLHYILKRNYNYAIINLKNNKLHEWQYIGHLDRCAGHHCCLPLKHAVSSHGEKMPLLVSAGT